MVSTIGIGTQICFALKGQGILRPYRTNHFSMHVLWLKPQAVLLNPFRINNQDITCQTLTCYILN